MENLKQGLSPKEVKTIQMALAMMIEDLEATSKDISYPFTPQARKELKDMLLNSKSAKAKIDLASGHECVIQPYVEGDEKEFLTKES
jgi:hypothetical protein